MGPPSGDPERCVVREAGGGRLTEQRLSLPHSELVVELFADHSSPGVKLVRRHVGDLQQHGRHQVHALQQLQVDVHVERHLKTQGSRVSAVGHFNVHIWGRM